MSNIPNRRDRRAAMKHTGLLKQKRHLPFSEWQNLTKKMLDRGKEIHEANQETWEKENTEALEEKESNAISVWKEDGYSAKEIEMLREAWAIFAIKDKDSWKTEKKVARKLMKEATGLRNKRLFS